MNSQTTTSPVNRRVLVRLLNEDAILAAVEKVSVSIRGIYKQDELFRLLLERVFDSIPAKRGVVLLAGPKAEALEPATFRDGEFSVSLPLPAQALRDHVGILSGGVLCAPLGDLGVIYLESARGKEFTTHHLHLLIALADEAALPAAYTAQIERVERENQDFRNYTYVDRGIVGQSKPIRDVHNLIKKVAPRDTRVLITGESGTGKDLVARAIHANSPRNEVGPFVTVNCAAIPNDLVESELFGHERGAFTGATELQKGTVEAAMGGTLFLDEVGELSLTAQAKLLRYIETGEFKRVGSQLIRHSDARIIAATNRDMKQWVATGKFREDLYFRLRIVEFRMPALRERRDDIALLAKHFLPKFRLSPSSAKGFSSEALADLKRYDWPGNVRQLHSVVEQAVIFCDSEFIESKDLHQDVTAGKPVKAGPSGYKAQLEAFAKDLILTTLRETDGNFAAAARRLGMTPSGMRRLAGRLGVKLT